MYLSLPKRIRHQCIID